MSSRTMVVVSFSLGTTFLMVFLVVVSVVFLCFIHTDRPMDESSFRSPMFPNLNHPRKPIGNSQSSDSIKERELQLQYGPVNTAKQKENKNALGDRLRYRRYY